MSCSLSSVFDNFRYIFFQINNNSLSSVLKARLGRLRSYRLLLKCSFLLLEPIFFSLNLLFRLLDRLDDLRADGLFAHPVGKAPDHFQCHVGFQKRAADLAHGFRHILLRQGAAPGKGVEDGAKPVLESVLNHYKTCC